MIKNFPTKTEVENADRYLICKWHRHLRSPNNEHELEINNLIFKRFNEFGGFTPELSKQIGW